MKEIIRKGLRFPMGDEDYEIPPELGEELMRLNQEMIDAKNRQAREVSGQIEQTGEEVP